VRAGGRWSWSFDFHLGAGIQRKRLGIVGLGQIGTAVARRGRAFGMDVAYAGRRRAAPGLEDELDAVFLPLDELFSRCDVVSLHCPLTPETRHLADARRLALMKPSAFLVNTTRGPVVDEAALVEALRRGAIAGAGLDVFEREPEVHPGLLELENAVLLPHLGSSTVETRIAMADLAARNAIAVLGGEPPLTPVAMR
jgi:glyoxylate reductase